MVDELYEEWRRAAIVALNPTQGAANEVAAARAVLVADLLNYLRRIANAMEDRRYVDEKADTETSALDP
jgi:hypothetical protein